MSCNCGCNGADPNYIPCPECEALSDLEQLVLDAVANEKTELEHLRDDAKDSADAAAESADEAAQSASEAKHFRDDAQTAANSATGSLKTIMDNVLILEESGKLIQQAADDVLTAIASIAVRTWYYTITTDGQTQIPVPANMNVLAVQNIYIEGVRQDLNRGFTFDKPSMTITLARGLPKGLEITVVLGAYNTDPANNFPLTLASNNGASLVGSTSGKTVQAELDALWERSLAEAGLTPVIGNFNTGATLTSADQVLRDSTTGEYYRWDGVFPKTVSAGSTPASSGGIGLGAWLSVGDASLRAALKNTDDDNGDALLGVKQPLAGAVAITQHQHNLLIISPVHFGLIGDGTYHPLSERFSTLAAAQNAYPNVSGLSLADSIDYAAIQQADYQAARIGMTLSIPACHAQISKTIIRKANWGGQGRLNSWNREAPDDTIVYDGRGTLLTPYGPGNPAKWTDETGSDTTAYTPFIVNARSELSIYDMTIYCYPGTRWSAGIFCPAVRRQHFQRCNILGWWADAGVREDATWSSINTTLTSLHPDVESDAGCNEYTYIDCFITGLRGVRCQGTLRPVGTVPSDQWPWSPGGTSDHNYIACRLGTEGPVDEKLTNGAGYWHDAVIPNNAGAGQSINFTDTSIRVSAKYAVYLDHSNMIRMSNTYAETISSWVSAHGAAINSCTDNTGAVVMWPDANGQRWYKNGILVTNNSLVNWRDCRKLVKMRDDGFFSTPNFHASASSNDPLIIATFNSTGLITFCKDDGTNQNPIWLMGDGILRPNADGGGSLGTATYHLNNVYAKALLVKQNMRPIDANTVNSGTATFPWGGGYTQTAFTVTSDERYKSRPLELTDAMLDACEEVDLIQFQYIDRIMVKGEDNARWHFGVIAQRVQEAFMRHGLDPHLFAFFCYDPEQVVPAEYETVQAVTKIIPAEFDSEGRLISKEREVVLEPAYEKMVKESYIVGEKYGIRYEEFLVLRAATIERKASRLEDALYELTKRIEILEKANQ